MGDPSKKRGPKALDLRELLTPMAAMEPPRRPCGDGNPCLPQDTSAAWLEARWLRLSSAAVSPCLLFHRGRLGATWTGGLVRGLPCGAEGSLRSLRRTTVQILLGAFSVQGSISRSMCAGIVRTVADGGGSALELVHGQGVILQCTGQGVLVCVIGAVLPSQGVILREALLSVLGTREEDVLANSGCRNKIPPTGWLKQQKCIFSWF